MLWEGRRSLSKAALLPSLPAFLVFGPSLFQLFSMNCRCPLFGRREEVRKPLLPEGQNHQQQQGWGLAEKLVLAACLWSETLCDSAGALPGKRVIHQRERASCIPGTQCEGKEDLIQS